MFIGSFSLFILFFLNSIIRLSVKNYQPIPQLLTQSTVMTLIAIINILTVVAVVVIVCIEISLFG